MKEFKKARFWFAPIWWNHKTHEIRPRLKTGILFEIALFLHNSMLTIASFLELDIEPGYPIKIIGD
jgi:hypothetical protein